VSGSRTCAAELDAFILCFTAARRQTCFIARLPSSALSFYSLRGRNEGRAPPGRERRPPCPYGMMSLKVVCAASLPASHFSEYGAEEARAC
jgi:hypothetical protein